jgi:hypothetical protein
MMYAERMREVLGRPHLHELAVTSSFCQRKSKLSPEVFFDMLFYTVAHTEQGSLSYMASCLESESGICITKQSLDERFNSTSVAYAKAVLSEVLKEAFAKLYSSELLPAFSRTRIKDSTKFIVPVQLEGKYKRCLRSSTLFQGYLQIYEKEWNNRTGNNCLCWESHPITHPYDLAISAPRSVCQAYPRQNQEKQRTGARTIDGRNQNQELV